MQWVSAYPEKNKLNVDSRQSNIRGSSGVVANETSLIQSEILCSAAFQRLFFCSVVSASSELLSRVSIRLDYTRVLTACGVSGRLRKIYFPLTNYSCK